MSSAQYTGMIRRIPSSCLRYFSDRRVYPVVAGLLRRSTVDLNFNGYAIPAGEKLFWSVLPAVRSKQLYSEPER